MRFDRILSGYKTNGVSKIEHFVFSRYTVKSHDT